MNILILLSYYNRPKLVKKALNSILVNDYKKWELYFCDDSSPISGEDILKETTKDVPNKIVYFNTNRSVEEKIKNGLQLGYYANLAMKQSDADIVIVLCDDDQLHHNYLGNINNFFIENSDIMYCYSYVDLYNPITDTVPNGNIFNKYYFEGIINPVGKIDVSQVAWRMECFKQVQMPESTIIGNKPWLKDTDLSWFEQLYNRFGGCHPTGFISQHKGIHDYQLVWHKKTTDIGLNNYMKTINKLAGEIF